MLVYKLDTYRNGVMNLKQLISLITVAALLFLPTAISAEEETYSNPPLNELDELITELALAHDVPPEIVKSVAQVESGLQQFKDGEPLIASDGGIGMMQVTEEASNEARRFDEDRLKEDIAYNIESGIKILQEKKDWAGNQIPELQDAEWYHLESWYFPVMAYNGLVHANSPIRRADESLNEDAYQEKVFDEIKTMNTGLDFEEIRNFIDLDDLNYREDNRLSFTIDSFDIPDEDLTISRYILKEGQKVMLTGQTNLRSDASRSSDRLNQQIGGTLATLTSNDLFDRTFDIQPDMMNYSRMSPWFQIRIPDQSSGYVSGGLIQPVTPVLIDLKDSDQETLNLTDIDSHWARDKISHLAKANVISGYNDHSFRPDNEISRQEFTHLVSNIVVGIPEEINTSWSFSDAEPNAWATDSIMTAYQLEIITGFPNDTFRPRENVTRAQIAVMIDRLLNLIDADLPEQEAVTFSDNHPDWADEAIQTISGYGIINGYNDGTFKAEETASRAEVAVILKRIFQ